MSLLNCQWTMICQGLSSTASLFQIISTHRIIYVMHWTNDSLETCFIYRWSSIQCHCIIFLRLIVILNVWLFCYSQKIGIPRGTIYRVEGRKLLLSYLFIHFDSCTFVWSFSLSLFERLDLFAALVESTGVRVHNKIIIIDW